MENEITSSDSLSLLAAMLKREIDPEHQSAVAQAEAAELAVVSAQERLNRAIRTLEHAPSTGFIKEVEAAAKEEADAKEALMSAQASLQKLRGDDIDEPPAELSQAQTGPTPLTTNEIANCFDGFKGWSRARWKSELGSPDKWLKDCQERPGTRGRSGLESTWWPVLIAAALVRQDPKMARNVKARFKRQEPLMPWLDVLEVNIPDDTDSL